MNESLYHNKIAFLNKREHSPSFLIWLSIFLAILIWASCFIEIRLSYKTTGYFNEETNSIEIFWPFDTIEKLYQYEQMKIDGKLVNLEILNMSEIKKDEQNLITYQIISLKSPEKYRKNQTFQLLLYDKKERIIEKAKKIILGG